MYAANPYAHHSLHALIILKSRHEASCLFFGFVRHHPDHVVSDLWLALVNLAPGLDEERVPLVLPRLQLLLDESVVSQRPNVVVRVPASEIRVAFGHLHQLLSFEA